MDVLEIMLSGRCSFAIVAAAGERGEAKERMSKQEEKGRQFVRLRRLGDGCSFQDFINDYATRQFSCR